MSAKRTSSPAVAQIAEQWPAPTPVSMLLTPEQLAEKLAVSVAWVRDQTRHRTYVREKDPLPCVRLGKFVRFRWSDIEQWIDRQRGEASKIKRGRESGGPENNGKGEKQHEYRSKPDS